MPIDEATRALLARMAGSGAPPLCSMSPSQARASSAAIVRMYGRGPDASSTDYDLDGGDGARFPVRVLRPASEVGGVGEVGDVDGVIVYYHGGGWVVGDIDGFDSFGRSLAVAANCAVVLVGYRKAPEHPYPTPVEDAWRSLEWVAANVVEIAGNSVPIVIAGDSAGGNLAAVMAHRSRDRGGPDPAQQVLVYPVTDCDLETESYLAQENQLMLDRSTMTWFWDHYAVPERRTDPELSPLRAADLRGLPPAVVVLAEFDVLRDEAQAYADALTAAGIPTDTKVFEGQMHGFLSMVDVLPGSAAGIEYLSVKITECLRSARVVPS